MEPPDEKIRSATGMRLTTMTWKGHRIGVGILAFDQNCTYQHSYKTQALYLACRSRQGVLREKGHPETLKPRLGLTNLACIPLQGSERTSGLVCVDVHTHGGACGPM